MNSLSIAAVFFLAALALGGCVTAERNEASAAKSKFEVGEKDVSIGGAPVIALLQAENHPEKLPQILEVELLPGRGMNVFQIKAFVPGKGIVPLLASPRLMDAKEKLESASQDNKNGNQTFTMGGAILVPYANRIRGKYQPKDHKIETTVQGKKVRLPANWKGKAAKAEPHAMHGLMLSAKADEIKPEALPDQARVTAVYHAKDFGGHWPSQADVTVVTALKKNTFGLEVTVKNVGKEPLPIGIGWHPYFLFPSEKREQAKLRLPASRRGLVTNYDDVFPTGKSEEIKGTAYDFSPASGTPLSKTFLDDLFFEITQPAVAEIQDPAAGYGLRLKALSPEIKAFQVYAPVKENFVAVEPQFNLTDPFSSAWKGTDTGMVTLAPGQSTTYAVELELFVP